MSTTSDPGADLRGFGPLGILAILLILLAGNLIVGPIVVPVGALLALLWVRLSNMPWRAIGYAPPRSWVGGVLAGLAFGCAYKLVLKAGVMPLLGAPAVNPAYHYLAGNTGLLPAAVLSMFIAGFGEETVFRGFLFERFGKLLGQGTRAKIVTVLATSALFALAHLRDQGLAGAEQAAMTGLAFGTIYAVAGRLWVVIWAHIGYDLAALALIYLNLEPAAAHLIFK